MSTFRLDIVTALPELVSGPLKHSIMRRAGEKGVVRFGVYDIRDWADPDDPHRKIDDYPYGGGAGMVIKAEPLFRCIEELSHRAEAGGRPYDEVVYLTPDGEKFDQPLANELSLKSSLLLIAGHYEGIDQRVRDTLVTREISIGDYVLSGGELAALVIADAVVRLLPGVLGDGESALTDSFQDDLLGAPVYTRPATFRGMDVPEILLSGDRKKIAAWREQKREEKTAERRPDLMEDEASIGVRGRDSELVSEPRRGDSNAILNQALPREAPQERSGVQDDDDDAIPNRVRDDLKQQA